MNSGVPVPTVVVLAPEVDHSPRRLPVSDRHACQGWRCALRAAWMRWRGRYCYSHAIRAGWLPGPVIRPGTQLEFRA